MFFRNDLWCDSYGKPYKIRIGDYIFHYLIIVCEIGGNDIQRVKGIINNRLSRLGFAPVVCEDSRSFLIGNKLSYHE